MKKIICIILTICLLFAFSGCSSKEKKSTSSEQKIGNNSVITTSSNNKEVDKFANGRVFKSDGDGESFKLLINNRVWISSPTAYSIIRMIDGSSSDLTITSISTPEGAKIGDSVATFLSLCGASADNAVDNFAERTVTVCQTPDNGDWAYLSAADVQSVIDLAPIGFSQIYKTTVTYDENSNITSILVDYANYSGYPEFIQNGSCPTLENIDENSAAAVEN